MILIIRVYQGLRSGYVLVYVPDIMEPPLHRHVAFASLNAIVLNLATSIAA